MAQHDIGSLVVMDHGKLAGMLTVAEVLRALAERRGQLGNAVVADIYEREVDETVDALASLREPLFMVILGVVVGGSVSAIYLPFFKLGPVV